MQPKQEVVIRTPPFMLISELQIFNSVNKLTSEFALKYRVYRCT